MAETVHGTAEIEARLRAELPTWTYGEGYISRVYETSGFRSTLMIVNAIGHLAEAAWHHPDMIVSYARVEVRLTTHSAGGVTDKDFALARKIEDLVLWHPAGEGGLEGLPANDPRFAYVKRS